MTILATYSGGGRGSSVSRRQGWDYPAGPGIKICGFQNWSC